MKFAVLDIETSNLNADFGFILCAVVKTYSKDEIRVFRIDKYAKKWYKDRNLVKDLINYLEDYDGIITYNGKRFDIPFIQSRAMFWRERPLKRLFHIDVYNIVKYKLKLHNAKLSSLIEFLNSNEEINIEIEEKTRINNIHYVRAVTGDKRGLDYLTEHCVKDVIALEQCYEFMKNQINILRRSI